MENITAFFKNREDMDRAASALREQGAIDIQLYSAGQTELGELPGASAALGMSSAEEHHDHHILQVVVESSRFRQAEDTLARFGGQR
ncbi:hypothetical protein ACFQ88_26960 [Paenibacillus sp. NPDC056579]|uniref:hypothetical protein n=1 Tax=Paenibacillus sp. NPDC056579 TaxID=3345871 RepID=UPI003689634C